MANDPIQPSEQQNRDDDLLRDMSDEDMDELQQDFSREGNRDTKQDTALKDPM